MLPALDKPDWHRDGAHWPNRAASRFVQAAGLTWHVQVLGPEIGTAPAILLIHGTGAASHSWRDVAPLLADQATVVVPDLPGHGFTETPPRGRLGLTGMAASLRDLLEVLDLSPEVAAGHSAGMAILMRLALDAATGRHRAPIFAPARLVGFNSALLPFRGAAAHIFSPLAKMLALNPLVPALASFRGGDERAVRRLIEETGSRLDNAGIEAYRLLFRRAGHVSATLAMMANWDLVPLGREMGRIACPVTLVVGEDDKAVSPDEAEAVAARLPDALVVRWPGLGHLAHEEAPEAAAEIIRAALPWA